MHQFILSRELGWVYPGKQSGSNNEVLDDPDLQSGTWISMTTWKLMNKMISQYFFVFLKKTTENQKSGHG